MTPTLTRRMMLAAAAVIAGLAAPRAAAAQDRCPPGYYQFEDWCVRSGPARSALEGSPYMGASMGYSAGTISDLGFVPDRTGWGVNVRTDIRLLSWLTAAKARGFLLWDLLYLDLDGLGKRTSDSVPMFGNAAVQGWETSTNAFNVDFGYELMAGMGFKRGAVLGGFRWDQYDYQIGNATMSGKAVPLALRVLLRPGRRTFVFQGYNSLGGTNRLRGVRVDIPFLGRTHLTGALERIQGTAVTQFRVQDMQFGEQPVPATWRRMHVGIRVLSGAALGLF
ncbi:MAG TPA: hypothetical protein VD793_10880 [Gemmatimonadales bacterium]|nr:hypothetical protein [Gemmatimonadales bacterium]